jgi:hypothetical protein
VALQGAIPVEFGMVFPDGAFAAGGFEAVRDFDASTAERFVPATDKDGVPLWVIEVIDADPEARARTVKVKVAAKVQPVLPSAPSAGSPFVPVEFTGLAVTPYVAEKTGRLAYSFKASGVRAPGRSAGRGGESKTAGEAA